MSQQTIDYVAVLRDLQRQRTQLNERFDAAVAAIKQVMALQATIDQPVLPGLTVTVPPASALPYASMKMLDAAFEHLRRSGKAVPNMKLAKALEDGGFPHKSKNFPNTLNSVLWRHAKETGELEKTQDGWSIVEKP